MTNDGRFEAIVQSEGLNCQAVIAVNEDHLRFEGPGKILIVPYSNIDLFYINNYRMYIETDNIGQITLSKMGRDMDSMYEQLWNGYNDRTLKAFFVSGTSMFETEGEYRYSEDGGEARGRAKIKLYEDCLCILPPDAGARRIPLCFMREPVMTDFTISMALDTDEHYEVIRLGSSTRRLFELINENIRAVLDKAAATALEMDGSLSSEQVTSIARLMPEGAAASAFALGAYPRRI